MTTVLRKIKPVERHHADTQTRGRRLSTFLGQLRERKVCRAAVIYMLATWLMLQLGEIIFPALQLPAWTLTLLVVIAALEFPVAMVLAWLFDLTPDGVVIDAPAVSSHASTGTSDWAINIALLLIAALLSVQIAWSQGADEPTDTATTAAPVTVVVLGFSKPAGIETGVAHGLEDEIRHQLMQASAGVRVTTLADGTDDRDPDSGAATLAIDGTVYTSGEQIRLLVQLIDLQTGDYLRSVSLNAVSAKAAEARKRLAQRVATLVAGHTDAAGQRAGLDNPATRNAAIDSALTVNSQL